MRVERGSREHSTLELERGTWAAAHIHCPLLTVTSCLEHPATSTSPVKSLNELSLSPERGRKSFGKQTELRVVVPWSRLKSMNIHN